MPFVISYSVSEDSSIEWDIPNIRSFSNQLRSFDSPTFWSFGCMWKLNLQKNASGSNFGVSLFRLDSNIGVKTVTFVTGIKNDGTWMKEIMEELGHGTHDFMARTGWTLFNFHNRGFLLSKLTITCGLKCISPTRENVMPKPLDVDTQEKNLVELEALSSDFKDLLDSGRRCDVTISVQGKEFRAHKAVLSARSSVFRAMYEHDTSENETGYLTIPDCDPQSFGDFLRYIYTGKMEKISFHSAYHLFGTAEKYDVQKLKAICLHHVRQNLAVENLCEVLVLADQYSDEVLMSSVQDFFNSNFSKIFQTPEWKDMLRKSPRLVDKLLSEFVPAGVSATPKLCTSKVVEKRTSELHSKKKSPEN